MCVAGMELSGLQPLGGGVSWGICGPYQRVRQHELRKERNRRQCGVPVKNLAFALGAQSACTQAVQALWSCVGS